MVEKPRRSVCACMCGRKGAGARENRSAAQVQPLADLPGWSASTVYLEEEEVEHPAIGGAAALDSSSESDYDDGSGGAVAASSDGSGGVAAASRCSQSAAYQKAWVQCEGGQSYTARFFWKGNWWEAPATLVLKAAPKQMAQVAWSQAAKGRTVQQTTTDQQQKTTTGPAQTTKATVPERYQDKTPAEDQELAGLNKAIMSLSWVERWQYIIQVERREQESLTKFRHTLRFLKGERRKTIRQLYPEHAHLLPPPRRPPSPEPQQQGEKASSLTPQP